MIKISGKYNTAIIFTDNVDRGAIDQITDLCNEEFVKDSIIRIMPDVHTGIGCTIGTTMTISDKVVPNLVGVDIGCGMETVKLKDKNIDLKDLDRIIHDHIPAGFKIRNKPHRYIEYIDFDNLACKKHIDLNRAKLSIGTLGGGNHFIEVKRDEEGALYLVVHSGSRHLGKQAAEYYQDLGYRELVKKHGSDKVKKNLAYLEGESFINYLNDMKIIQKYAEYNRKAIIDEIMDRMGLEAEEEFTTIHNYIDLDAMILRKGAISAKKGERVLIPINMRDGSLICIGKGNKDWNYSAPHGAGRIMSRRQAKKAISLEEFQKSMKGIYTTTVSKHTLDEAAFAYKPMDEIINNIKDTVDIIHIIRPIYNFKAN